MKKISLTLWRGICILCILVSVSFLWSSKMAYANDKKTTKVCVDVKDKSGRPVKDAKGKVKQNCKEMKVHKKLEGKRVPEKTKK